MTRKTTAKEILDGDCESVQAVQQAVEFTDQFEWLSKFWSCLTGSSPCSQSTKGFLLSLSISFCSEIYLKNN